MSLHNALMYELKNDSDLSAHVGGRVYPIRPPRGVQKYPLLTVTLSDTEHETTMSGMTGLANHTYEITVMSPLHSQTEDTAEALRQFMGFKRPDAEFGEPGSEVSLVSSILQDTRDGQDSLGDASDDIVYTREMDFDLWWREPTS